MAGLTIENRTFDAIRVGDTASIARTLTPDDIRLFAAVSGDVNPAHMDPDYAETDMFRHVIAHGMWSAGLISAVLGTELQARVRFIALSHCGSWRPSASETRSPPASPSPTKANKITLSCSIAVASTMRGAT